MIISFDLDDTLFVSEDKFDVEKPLPFPFNLIFKERLRLGSIELMKYIRKRGIGLWIYTTSYRSVGYIYSQLKTFSKKLISYFHIENDWGIMVSIWLRGETRDEW